MVSGQQDRNARIVPEDEIRHSVRFLLSVQESDGTYRETQRMLHRGVLVTFTACQNIPICTVYKDTISVLKVEHSEAVI